MTTGATYEKTRIGLGFSRAKVSALAKRAGHTISQTSVNRLERDGAAAVGTRGLSPAAVAWLEYLYGLAAADVDWSAVERGAPVVVHGEKGTFALHAVADDGRLRVWGGPRNQERLHTLAPDVVRLVAPTVLPSPELASRYETHARRTEGSYAVRIMEFVRANAGAHSVGSLAYELGLDHTAVSRVACILVRRGELEKVHRGVFVLHTNGAAPSPEPIVPVIVRAPKADLDQVKSFQSAPPAEEVKAALAERVRVPSRG